MLSSVSSTSTTTGNNARNKYAIATADTAFKHMLSLSNGNTTNILISFLNCFVPAFRDDRIVAVEDAPVAIPALQEVGQKQKHMDLHVVSSKKNHYIIEMQAGRHLMFDERALFYACSTYSRQLSQKDLVNNEWYIRLHPVIALQILDYDTNRIIGFNNSHVIDNLVAQVTKHPLPPDQFIKHYMLTDKSGQTIDHLQMIQVELPRAELHGKLFPPRADFTISDWWISVLRHAPQYTEEMVHQQYEVDKVMPLEIYEALKRLDLETWNPDEALAYDSDLASGGVISTAFQDGIAEGEQRGIVKGERNTKRESIKRMRSISMDDIIICQVLNINESDLISLMEEE